MSLADLKAAAIQIVQSTSAAAAPEVLADHLLIKKNRPQLIALTKLLLSTLNKRKNPKPSARRKAGPHRKKRELVPTSEQKIGALAARSSIADQIIFDHKLRGGKMLGEIKVHELPSIVEKSAGSATAMLTRGYEDAVDTFLCASLADHCVAVDPFVLVKDTVKASVAAKMLERAKLRAAEVLRDKSALLAKELIALAHTPAAA
jgi:hypothetical protein